MPAKKQVTKEMILNAALKLLQEQGYDAVNLRQLAKELGCSTQPVYLSFSLCICPFPGWRNCAGS